MSRLEALERLRDECRAQYDSAVGFGMHELAATVALSVMEYSREIRLIEDRLSEVNAASDMTS